jgi:hypothetical protein
MKVVALIIVSDLALIGFAALKFFGWAAVIIGVAGAFWIFMNGRQHDRRLRRMREETDEKREREFNRGFHG